MNCPTPPGFLGLGASGSLIFQIPAIFGELALPILKRLTCLAAEAWVPTHVHSCDPEAELVRMAPRKRRTSPSSIRSKFLP